MLIKDFIEEFNKQKKGLEFGLQTIEGTGKPTVVEIRYNSVRFKKNLTSQDWKMLLLELETRSKNSFYIVTDQFLFERGVMAAKIASCNHNFSEERVVNCLKFLVEFFL